VACATIGDNNEVFDLYRFNFVGTTRTAVTAIALIALAGTMSVHAEPTEADFIVARDAFRAGDAVKLDRVAPRLKDHLLESYVVYWQIRLKLDEASPERVQAFLERNDGRPLADRLRVEWLKSLARRGEWASFAVQYPRRVGEDTELACYAIQWRQTQQGDAALDEARPYWLTGQEQPESCRALFAAMIASGKLTDDDVWARFRLAHEAGNNRLAAGLVARLPSGDAATQREFDSIDHNFAKAVAKGNFQFKSRASREFALYALDRAARADPVAAHDGFSKWRNRLPETERRYAAVLIAYNAARQLMPGANEWYREAGSATMNEQERAWRIRAALREGNWPDVARAIAALPEAEAQEPAWRYWKARALAAEGKDDDATRLYGTLAAEHHFYGFMAAEAIGAAVMPVSEPLPPDADAIAAFGARDGVQRVVRLTALDLRPEALREWQYVVRGLDDDALLLAAQFAQRSGLYDRSINSADRTQRRHDFALRYQTPYRDQIGEAARENGLDEAWVFGLTRQESRFVADIVSSAGATGLMQLMRPTAKWVAKQTGRDDFQPTQLDQPLLNAELGAYYLRYVLDRLDGLPVLATAAYNAGPGRAQAWRAATPLEGAIYAETIPFNETRDYVKKVLSNAMFYQAQLGLPYVALKDRLGIVMPRGTNSIAAAPATASP
jgi:soluble lytic murein transglycosylase